MRKITSVFSLLTILLIINPFNAGAQFEKKKLAGSWLGTLEIGAIRLRIVFNLTLTQTDSLTATLDSPDQNAKNIPLGKVTATSDSLRIEAPLLNGRYAGRIVSDTTITGTWSQSGQTFPLNIRKLPERFSLTRPQEPQPPFPYRTEEVTIPNMKFNIYLSGTLTLPEGEGPFPAAILITGSGPQNRDEAIMGHKPFLVLADYLTRNGIAVLRYDDRGVGKSQGVYAEATTADLATDAEAAFEFLKNHKNINPSAIGLIGHSEGGLIACITAASNPGVAFIVSLAGPGVKGEDILFRQQADISRLSGVKEATIKQNSEINRKLYNIVKKETDDFAAEEKVMATYAKLLKKQKKSPQEIDDLVLQLQNSFGAAAYPWFRYFLTADPAQFWKKVKCPVLALNGDKDTQIAADVNLPAIENALRTGGNNSVKSVKFPGLNHLFQHCKTGLPAEYGQIEETMSPEVLKTIASWIRSLN
ncbi:MAG TPA: alpha/beta fold hydrolase [Bacteroidales bacterium]|nr:alpha/beta fold hydrolase [Bacteroidales bacterium]HOK75503.1 alpha/beta fold hydrolase [Bacteroidales bacterium]HOM40138.1 alpha/beta fold hydrolase [Bacteroidales bacterium]HPP93236.1 alpha/beta fold hydrolase [Bacteroidales bacterium]HQK71845.1 alpha/beta fold hydrolase [Bacteroidales bacterium]